jgi:transcriptional regulator with XRE-family HTH domain
MGVEVRINVEFVKAERERRAWSQEQLAGASGVGLRTIQRVESSGVASNETIKALAAVFECEICDLTAQPVTTTARPWRKPLAAGAALSVTLLAAVLIVAARARAGEILMGVTLGTSGLDTKAFKFVTREGTQSEGQIDKQLRIVLIPTNEPDDRVMINAEIYVFEDGKYTLLSRPRLLTRSGVDARIEVRSNDGQTIGIDINPRRL